MTKQPRLLKVGELMGKANIRRSIKDRELRSKLTPDYRAGCKRILNSDNYYPAIATRRPRSITDGIARFTPNGIVTTRRHRAAGRRRSCSPPASTSPTPTPTSTSRAPGGEDLVDRWNREGVAAHRGIMVADMPNLFFLLGPNTGARAQLGGVHDRIADPLRRRTRSPPSTSRARRRWPRPRAAQDRFNDELQHDLAEHRVEHRRLPQLVHGRARRQPDAVERV